MKNNTLRTPLLQSTALLGGVVILLAIAASSASTSNNSGVISGFIGIFNAVVFVIGLVLALAVSIAVLIAIFLAAVAMVSPDHARNMYSDIKKNLGIIAATTGKQLSNCRNNADLEDYNLMKLEIDRLQKNNSDLQNRISELKKDGSVLQNDFNSLREDNITLKATIDELTQTIETLKNSEADIKQLVADLATKVSTDTNLDVEKQLETLKEMHLTAHTELEKLSNRLVVLESQLNQSPVAGIFSYMEDKDDQALFIKKIKEALSKELTYSQIDEFLTENLPTHLDTIIKDHPALTKNYIRNLRRE